MLDQVFAEPISGIDVPESLARFTDVLTAMHKLNF